jgi:two-component system sensor histidine kinase YcbA
VLKGKPLEEAQAAQALTIARSIHEIKKDYTRVISGIEKIVQPSARSEGIQFSEIMFIIEQNTNRYLSSLSKNIHITFECRDDFLTDKHYIIASILDNLITNAIEATAIEGTIKVCQECRNDMVVFSVEDAGIGIAPDDYELIFEPGYSTKFSAETGKMSTGLGLAHVRNLTTALDGEIQIQSEAGRFTLFTIQIPYQRLALKP